MMDDLMRTFKDLTNFLSLGDLIFGGGYHIWTKLEIGAFEQTHLISHTKCTFQPSVCVDDHNLSLMKESFYLLYAIEYPRLISYHYYPKGLFLRSLFPLVLFEGKATCFYE